ncbi:MAG: hypothetical protein CML17_12305 [Pusillimonas sp.]|nr:hypothetical protein [Pusillimonas sp.]
MRFENDDHRQREQRAITKFCSLFDLTFRKLGENDIDFQIFKSDRLVGFVEVKGRHRIIADAYPLPIAIRKLNKLQGELAPREDPVIVWACHDGIIYGKVRNITGTIRYGGRKVRDGASNDQELMAYFNPQEDLHHERY